MISKCNSGSSTDRAKTQPRWRRITGKKSVQRIVTYGLLLFVVLNCISSVFGEIEPLPPENDDDFQDIVAKNDDSDSSGTSGDTNNVKIPTKISVPNTGFIHAFIASFSVIIVSELGDKTFFIAAIMAMKHPRITVFGGAIAALALMTVLSALFGQLAQLIPRVYTYYISAALFAFFGLKMLKEGWYMKDSDAQEELEEVQSELKKREDQLYECGSPNEKRESVIIDNNSDDHPTITSATNNNNISSVSSQSSTDIASTSAAHNNGVIVANGGPLSASASTTKKRQKIESPSDDRAGKSDEIEMKSLASSTNRVNDDNRIEKEQRQELLTPASAEAGGVSLRIKPSHATIMVRIFIQAFTMTFLAEWGDRSQLATIILAARDNVWGVIVGGVIGHAICTGLAVIGGRMIAQKISVRTVTLIGGVVFLLFAVSALFFDPNEEAPPDV